MTPDEGAPPAGQRFEVIGGSTGLRIVLTRHDDGYVAVSSPDDPSLDGALWETSRSWNAPDDCYEVSIPPRWGGSELTWQQVLRGL
jgi:hypothetical protein